jgi:hypothetical protein
LGPWAAAWAARLSTLTTTATAAGGPFATSKQHLQQALHALLANSPWAPFTWHSLRRMGAAALAVTGTPLPTICAWGRWHSQSIACHYTRHPPGWHFPSPALLPWPKAAAPSPTFEIRPTLPAHIWPPAIASRHPCPPPGTTPAAQLLPSNRPPYQDHLPRRPAQPRPQHSATPAGTRPRTRTLPPHRTLPQNPHPVTPKPPTQPSPHTGPPPEKKRRHSRQ